MDADHIKRRHGDIRAEIQSFSPQENRLPWERPIPPVTDMCDLQRLEDVIRCEKQAEKPEIA